MYNWFFSCSKQRATFLGICVTRD